MSTKRLSVIKINIVNRKYKPKHVFCNSSIAKIRKAGDTAQSKGQEQKRWGNVFFLQIYFHNPARLELQTALAYHGGNATAR